jgi:fucose 4-O-acetylase-like acetyltransferase
VRRIVIPFLLFNTIYVAFGYALNGTHIYTAATPFWLMWFLASLFCWRLLLPFFASISGLVAAFVLALAVGWFFEIGNVLSLSRTLYFLPFFVPGYLFGKPMASANVYWRSGTGLLMLTTVLLGLASVMMLSSGFSVKLLYGSLSYPGHRIAATLTRAGLIALSLLVVSTALILMPPGIRVLEYIGKRSLSVFLLHGFVVMGVRAIAPGMKSDELIMVSALCSSVLTVFLTCAASPIVDFVTGQKSSERSHAAVNTDKVEQSSKTHAR